MSFTIRRRLPASFILFILLASAAPAGASGEGVAATSTAQRIGLYSPRVRRSTVMYLRLRLLELREAGLERARAAIERRLSTDELLAEPAFPRHPENGSSRPPQLQHAQDEKAKTHERRTGGP